MKYNIFNIRITPVLLIVIGFTISNLLHAQISPGKLSMQHADLEGIKNCTNCHELGQEPTPEKCYKCHSQIKTRIDNGTGFHGSAKVKKSTCSGCHSDHHGRDFQLVYWEKGMSEFDHTQTGYTLEGGHTNHECRECHRKSLILDESLKKDKHTNLDRTFLGLGKDCLNCHADEHQGQVSSQCLNCHLMAKWKPPEKFDHNNAAYKLTGMHVDLKCEKCHTPQKAARPDEYKIQKSENKGSFVQFKTQNYSNCTPCHEDVHKGKMGNKCTECHNTKGFKLISNNKFDHSATDYNLMGRHSSVECKKCHTTGNMLTPVKFAMCTDCHADFHKGQFLDRQDKGECSACHDVNGFLPAFYGIENHQLSGYKLTGSHLAIPCNLCHKSSKDISGGKLIQFDFADKSCKGCHTDIHNKQADKWISKDGCEYCHITDSWRKVNFNHDLSTFRLTGKHNSVICTECHRRDDENTLKNALILRPIDTLCTNCHIDKHNGQFSNYGGAGKSSCTKCHSPKGWKQLSFEHNRDSKYILDGAHKNVNCALCHKPELSETGVEFVKYKPLGTECIDCHAGNPKSK